MGSALAIDQDKALELLVAWPEEVCMWGVHGGLLHALSHNTTGDVPYNTIDVCMPVIVRGVATLHDEGLIGERIHNNCMRVP